jgi:hypothetical protein
MEVNDGARKTRLYSLLGYAEFTLLIFGERKPELDVPPFAKVIHIPRGKREEGYWSENSPYADQAILVRPDSYIAWSKPA